MPQKLQKIELQSANGKPQVEIIFGHAHVGVYHCYLWDMNRKSTELAHGNNVDDVLDAFTIDENPNDIDGFVFSYELSIRAAENTPGRIYSITITIRQNGSVCKGGVIQDTGAFDDVKSIIGFRRFKTV